MCLRLSASASVGMRLSMAAVGVLAVGVVADGVVAEMGPSAWYDD